jgi:predicted PurR-regulated permease PerM
MSNQWSAPTRIIVLSLSIIFIIYVVSEIRPLSGPLVVAGLLAYVLHPATKLARKLTGLSYRWSVNLVYFVVIAILIATPGTLVPLAIRQVRTLSIELHVVEQQVQAFLETPPVILGQELPTEQILDDFLGMTTEILPAAERAISVLETTSVSLLWLVVIVVTTYYLLADWQGLRNWLVGLVPVQGQPDFERLLVEINTIWQAYVQGTLALMLIMGVAFIIIGLAIGLPGAVAIGLLTGLLSMIPDVGPTIAAIVAILVALFQGSNYLPISNFWFAVMVMAIYLVAMQIKSIWLRPIVMGRFMHMNTGLVFLLIIAAVLLQGILAALIVLPIVATLGVIGRYIRARLLNIEPWPEQQIEVTVTAPADDVTPSPAD